MNVTVMDMMEARDRRAQRQRELLAEFGQTLLCFTMNIPGPEKLSPLIRAGFRLGCRMLERGFLRLGVTPAHAESLEAVTGCEAFYVLPMTPEAAKALAIELEEAAPLGRLFDMDVLRTDGRKVERQELGFPGRKCLLCGNDAQACARSRTHTVAELQQKTRALLSDALRADQAQTVARLACQALLYEVLTTPKPGLVDRANSGSHSDMDVFTFAASTAALHPYFEQCALIGHDTAGQAPEQTFVLLRPAGKLAEGGMLAATHGVNTHRGAIFSVGILCAAAGRLDREDWRMPALLDACAQMTRGLTESDFAGLTAGNARTFGQRLYLAHGITGVRGQAEQGFPLVRDHGYPKLRAALAAGLSINDAGCAALLALMAQNTDTNVIHRGGMEAQRQLCHQAQALLEAAPYPSAAALEALDRQLIADHISPGGSADLLALCYLLYFLEEEAK